MPPSTGVCGNLVCESEKNENCLNCNLDCGLCPVIDDPDIPVPPSDPGQQWDGLDPNFQEHFSMDLSADEYPVEVDGEAGSEICNPLAGGSGQRDVVYRPAGGGPVTVVNTVANSWNFWALGIKTPGGRLAVCWNRLVGADTGATRGAMPDPRGGVALVCRTRDGGAWSAERVISAGLPAAWLTDLKVDGAGRAVVEYQRDSFGTFFNSGKPGDGLVETVLP
jgi:hypothetical protein